MYWQFICVISQKFKNRFVVITGTKIDTVDIGIRAVGYRRKDFVTNRVAKYVNVSKMKQYAP